MLSRCLGSTPCPLPQRPPRPCSPLPARRAGPILAQRHGGFLLPLLVSTWSSALLASMAGLSTPEASSALAEGAGAAVEKAREALAAAAPAGPGVEGPVEAKEE